MCKRTGISRRWPHDFPSAERRRASPSELVGEGDIARVAHGRYNLTCGGMTCGWEQGPAVGNGSTAPFRFSGGLESVLIAAEGAVDRDPAAEFDAIMSEP
jgi:hypothetical protein